MKIIKSQWGVAVAVLMAFGAVLLALLSSAQQGVQSEFETASVGQSAIRSSLKNRAVSRSPTGRYPIVSAGQAATRETTAALLQSLGITLNASAEESLQLEIDIRFTDFLAGLNGSPQRIEAIRQEFIAAYTDILAFGIALAQRDITPAEAEARTDPNYVVNQMAGLLTSEEMTELETLMESEARQRFHSTYSPQLDVIGVELSVDNRASLLETLFMETYLLVNRDGLGTTSDLVSGFQRQLEAIENTRDSLRVSMTPEQFTEANAFLSEQEQGLLGAQTIFFKN
ncbi:MAG: hypothetical protein JKY86_09825 [Gammaproteobacteria bacterium]|nr:hypothetical protein [Gammaproteobacteria bacterium]